MSHCGGEEEEKENRFSKDLKIVSRDQEDKRVRARWVLQGAALTEQQLDTRCHRVAKWRH